MPYQVEQLIKGKSMPVCVRKEDLVSKALSVMIERDFSQLPVVTEETDFDIPIGMITYEGILRGVRNFKAKIDDLKVRDVMMSAPIYSEEDDLFDILDRLKDTNAVLITAGDGPFQGLELVGIVTSYDTTDYFRRRTEDLMRVEDIELMVKDFIKAAYSNEAGELDENRLNQSIARTTASQNRDASAGNRVRTFGELTLNDYITLLLARETWTYFEPIFCLPRDAIRELLNRIRDTRNALAHFRGDLSAEERDQLKFCAEWLSRCQDEYQARIQKEEKNNALALLDQHKGIPERVTVIPDNVTQQQTSKTTDFIVAESAMGGGRYAALADWLQSQPGKIDNIQLTINQIEEIIQSDLPASARNHRAWWSNDSVGHSHSQLWLEAGWRTTYVNLNEGKVTFSRIREREKAYIEFFSKLLDELHQRASFPLREPSPDGTSWLVIRTILAGSAVGASFTYSFSRDRRLRVELYIDLGDQAQNKAVFDGILIKKAELEEKLGQLEWERLDNRRASRIAIYHEGQIDNESNHAQLLTWAAETMVKFVNAIEQPAKDEIARVIAR